MGGGNVPGTVIGVYFIGNLSLGKYYLVEIGTPDGIKVKDADGNETTQNYGKKGKIFTLEVTADGVANPTASSVEISVDKVEGEDVVPKNFKDWLKNQEKDTTDP